MVDLTNIVPTLVSSKLIFRHTDNNVTDKVMRVTSTTTPELFHKACDYKGPTLTIVSANYGFKFGAYSPIGWVPEYCYSEASDAFIFCLRRPRGIPDAKGDLTLDAPFVCYVKPGQTKMAIKQSEIQYSPGFGLTNKCDLLIAYKGLDNSYCRVGNIYEVPWRFRHLPEVDQWSLLAGRPTNWEV